MSEQLISDQFDSTQLYTFHLSSHLRSAHLGQYGGLSGEKANHLISRRISGSRNSKTKGTGSRLRDLWLPLYGSQVRGALKNGEGEEGMVRDEAKNRGNLSKGRNRSRLGENWGRFGRNQGGSGRFGPETAWWG